MATTIKLKNSVTTTSVPSSLVQGEVAINVTDKKVWVGNAATTPIQLLGGGADGNFTNISVSSVATFGAGTVSAPSITTTGDTNTGIFFPAADTIAFTEGGAESMRIDSSGNVGIGTSSPANRLHVFSTTDAAQLKVEGDGSTVRAQINIVNDHGDWLWGIEGGTTTGDGIIYTAGAKNLKISTNGTERMRIDSSGNLGLGTSSPLARLDVRTTSQAFNQEATISAYSTDAQGIDLGGSIALGGNADIPIRFGLIAGRKENSTSNNRSGYLQFATFENGVGLTEQMRITSGGLVQFNSGYGSVATAYGCRAWVNFDGTASIRASANVSSITDNGTGDFTINFTTAMPDANYAVTCNAADVNQSSLGSIGLRASTAPATGSVRVGSTAGDGSAFDFTYYHYAIFR
jgi:hypothetical protein